MWLCSISLGCGLFPLLRGGANIVRRGGIPFEREMSQRDKRIAVLQGGRLRRGRDLPEQSSARARGGKLFKTTFGLFEFYDLRVIASRHHRRIVAAYRLRALGSVGFLLWAVSLDENDT